MGPTETEERELTVADGEGGRADVFLRSHFPDLGRRELARLFEDGGVRRGGTALRKGSAIAPGDVIRVDRDLGGYELIAAAARPLTVVFVDDSLVAVCKPSGMPSHPLRRGESGTAANALVALFPDTRGVGDDPREGGLVHRLDTDTTGALLAARSRDAWERTRAQFREGRVQKTYLALVHGRAGAGASDEPLEMRGKRSVCSPAGRPASSRWEPVLELEDMTLLRVRAATGRTHQVRAHLAAAGHPLAGDVLYGAPGHLPGGHFLHAETLELPHPITAAALRIEAPLPTERLAVLESLPR